MSIEDFLVFGFDLVLFLAHFVQVLQDHFVVFKILLLLSLLNHFLLNRPFIQAFVLLEREIALLVK